MARWRAVSVLVLAACAAKNEPVLPAGPPPAPRLFDPLAHDPTSRLAFEADAQAPARVAFGALDGAIASRFLQEGPVATHLLLRSGESPRLIAAFAAGDAGIGLWFRAAPGDTQLSFAEAGDDALAAITRDNGEHPLHGVSAVVRSNASLLSSELVLLGSARTLRDYAQGECLEDAARFAALRNETFELDPEHAGLRIRRVEIGGAHSMELLLSGLSGTTITLRRREGASRPGCPRGDAEGQPVIELSREGGIELRVIALASDEPLTPFSPDALLRDGSEEGGDTRSALSFLSYREKLLAGSWRFLTYFGRDTLLSLWMLEPALAPEVVEQALGSVLERIQLEPGVTGPAGQALELGDVAHEEEIGDYAAWKNQALEHPPAHLRTPRYDYRMIDDDFLLAPLLARLAEASGKGPARTSKAKGDASVGKASTDAASASKDPRAARRQPSRPGALEALLGKRRGDGRSFEEAALANLALVLQRARPFADDPRAPADKKERLIALRDDSSVGDWRDSDMGLAFGRYPFDVNVALVPAALAAARTVYARLGRAAEAAEAARIGAAWRGVDALFRFELPLDQARANVQSYASAIALSDPSAALGDDGGGNVAEYGIALDGAGAVLPVAHSDHGFVLALGQPSDAYLRLIAEHLSRPFPAGLLSSAGLVVANPAFAAADLSVIDPRRRADPNDDVPTPLRSLFTPAHYHGTVVWSWQQALLAAGLRRQLARKDLSRATRRSLARAECALWQVIEATRAQGMGELWSWAPRDGRAEARPFGAGAGDADESNAVQLWSTVYLAVQKPAMRCAEAEKPQ
jgi:hypothetical protein